ncbi:MAG: hypothetical protein H7A21_06035 [Spirochaetales bacterium]|nr:hypothetical protein [Leptospiraceae bacterium]MCP5480970.1 hypothetical protein [Spirochaetales bacterium]MCP5485350.1 hypothetical protein [Spirochaetales bacterium]
MADDSEDNSLHPVDLQKHRLVRELEGEINGLFGINREDIAGALDRLWIAIAEGQYAERYDRSLLPPELERVLQSFETIDQICRSALSGEPADRVLPERTLELFDHYRERIRRLLADLERPDES